MQLTSNVAAALVKTQGPSEMDRTFYSRSTLSLLIVWQDQLLFQAAHTGPLPNVKQDLMLGKSVTSRMCDLFCSDPAF